jgi:hypothetical protein
MGMLDLKKAVLAVEAIKLTQLSRYAPFKRRTR